MLLLNGSLLFSQVSITTDGSAPDNSAILDVKSTTTGVLLPHMTSAQRNVITSPANGLMIFQTDGVSGFYYYNSVSWQLISESSHYIGELAHGGIVFWVDHTGQHGLIASLVGIGTTSTWSNVTLTLIGTTAQSTWNGQANTTAIIGQVGHSSSAAKLCDDYINADFGTGIFSDWYLPATDELVLIYNNRYILNKSIEAAGQTSLKNSLYWSSTENIATAAWGINISHGTFHLGAADGGTLKSASNLVRAVRAF